MKIRALDIIAIAATASLAILSFLPIIFSEIGTTASVIYDGGTLTLGLDKNASHTVASNGHELTVKVQNGEVFVSNSDCPDGLCERCGKIDKPGEVIVCLPAKVMIRVSGEGGVDGVAG